MDIELGFLVKTKTLSDAEKLVKRVGVETEKTATKVSNFGKNMRLTKGPTSALSTTAGQLGVQFQDVAVQAQMGTDAVRIFSQQGPQILSIFGPQGAVLGALAAIGVVVGTTIVDAFGLGEDAIEEFGINTKKVADSVNTLSDDFLGLSQSLVDLAEKSEIAARLQIALALDAADIAARNAKKAFSELGLEGSGMYRGLEEASQGANDLLKALDDINHGGGKTVSTLSIMKRASENLGISLDEIRSLGDLFVKAVDPDGDASALTAFSDKLGELAQTSGDPAFQQLALDFVKTALEAESTEEKARLLEKAMEDLAGAVGKSDDKAVQFVLRMERMAEEAGKTREQILKMQAAQIDDPELKSRAMTAIKAIEDQRKAEEKAAADKKKADEDEAFRKRVLNLGVQKAIQLRRQAEREAERERREAEAQANQERAEELKIQQIMDREAIKSRENVNNALLSMEDKLLKNKTEKQKAGFRFSVNMMNQEKRENAGRILSDSYVAAMGAYKALAGIPFIGPVLGAGAAATILAAGVSFATQSLAGRALGGQVRGGESYVVGERGPEVLTMGSSGRIIPNDKLSAPSQTNNQNVSVSFNITATDASGFDQLLQQRRGMIIGMINQAMNNRGRKALV